MSIFKLNPAERPNALLCRAKAEADPDRAQNWVDLATALYVNGDYREVVDLVRSFENSEGLPNRFGDDPIAPAYILSILRYQAEYELIKQNLIRQLHFSEKKIDDKNRLAYIRRIIKRLQRFRSL